MEEQSHVARINVFDLLLTLVKWRKLFVANFLIAVIIAVIVALTLPVWYSASTVILPPDSGMGGLPSFITSDLAGMAATFGLEIGGDEIYQTILGSRSLRERIVERFDLRNVYKMSDEAFPEDVIMAFDAHMSVLTLENQSILVTVEDQDAVRAKDLANACIEELDGIYSQISSETASSNRKFIEKRLNAIKDTIRVIQDSLVAFQHATGALQISDQMQAMFTAAATVKAEQLQNEVKLNVVRGSLGENHPIANQLNTINENLTRQYNAILEGSEGDVFIGIKELPEIGQQYGEIYRSLLIQNKILEFIYPQYESAKIQEQRETSNVQVLDKARVPSVKSRPGRKMIVMTTGMISILVTLVLVLIRDFWVKLPAKNQEDWEKLQEIGSLIRKWK